MALGKWRRFAIGAVAAGTVVALVPTVSATSATSAATGRRQLASVHLQVHGTVNLGSMARSNQSSAAAANGPDISPATDVEQDAKAPLAVAQEPLPHPASRRVTSDHPGVRGNIGLTHADQRLADNGNQFSGEPPDQGLCSGNGFLFEQVNSAAAVYDTNRNQLAPAVSLNRFFGLASSIDRTRTPPVYGPSLSDPRCYFDTDTHRWFVTILELEVNPYTGDFSGRSAIYIAVSQTSDPLGAYTRYSLDTTDDGTDGTPRRPNCPCLGDFPMIGFNATGFFITTREFPTFVAGFNGGLLYAMSKQQLAAAASAGSPFLPPVLLFGAGPLAGGLADRLQPTITAPGSAQPNNRAYFLASTNTTTRSARSIALYTLTGTNSLNTATPSLSLSRAIMPSELYGDPPRQRQRRGPRPLGEALGEPLPTVDSGDASFRSANYYTNGLLVGALATGVRDNGLEEVAAAYFVVKPAASGASAGTIVHQGYIRATGYDLSYPSVGVRANGAGLVTYSVLGPNVYPSVGYTTFNANSGATGPVRLVARGTAPQDGFSCYKAFDPAPRCRWGDYSATTVSRGSVFFAAEYIPPTARTVNANWGTFIAEQN